MAPSARRRKWVLALTPAVARGGRVSAQSASFRVGVGRPKPLSLGDYVSCETRSCPCYSYCSSFAAGGAIVRWSSMKLTVTLVPSVGALGRSARGISLRQPLKAPRSSSRNVELGSPPRKEQHANPPPRPRPSNTSESGGRALRRDFWGHPGVADAPPAAGGGWGLPLLAPRFARGVASPAVPDFGRRAGWPRAT
jgi:hypothetical protein